MSDGELIGYARVSTSEQKLDLQLDALRAAGVRERFMFTDTASGMRADRPGLEMALRTMRGGDVLIVWRLDRLARSAAELLKIAAELKERGVALRSLTEELDTASAVGQLMFTMFAAMAEFERNLTRERTLAGLASARAKGRRGGRKAKLTKRQLVAARAMLAELTADEVAVQLGVHRSTLYRALSKSAAETVTKLGA